MELKPIKNKTEYKAALREVEALFNAPEGTPQADKLEVLLCWWRDTKPGTTLFLRPIPSSF